MQVPPPRYVIRRSVSPVPTYATYVVPRFTRATSPVIITSTVPRLYSAPRIAIYTVPGAYERRTYPILTHKRVTTIPVVALKAGRHAAYLSEMSRINHRLRPRVGSEPCEDFLNSNAIVTFGDETRAIRARTQELLRRVNEPIPRNYYPDYQPPKVYDPYEDEEPMSHDEYIEQRVLNPMRHVHQDITTMSRFTTDPTRQYIGKGHLACVSFAGGRPISRRRAMPRCEEDRNIRDDVKFLSYYNRARAAATTPGTSLEIIKALLTPPYHRRDPEPELMVLPYSRPRAPASLILRFDASDREKDFDEGYNKYNSLPRMKREIRPYVPSTSKSKELCRLRLMAEKDAELGRSAYAECQQAIKAAKEAHGGDDTAELERIARKKQREMEFEEASRREIEERRAEREAAKLRAANESAEQEKKKKEDDEAARIEKQREEMHQKEAERRAEEMRKAEAERIAKEEADKKAEEERLLAEKLAAEEEARNLAEQARIAAEKKAEEDKLEAKRKAEEERIAAEKKAEEERLAEEARKAAEEARIAAEKKAEEEKLEAERKAEEERLAEEAKKLEEARLEAEKKAEEERLAEEARVEAENKVQEEAPATEVTEEVQSEQAPSETAAEPPAEESSTEKDVAAEISEPVAQETVEPVIEEPTSPDEAPLTNGSTNVNGNGTAVEELEIPLDGDSADAVVKKVQDASCEETTEAEAEA